MTKASEVDEKLPEDLPKVFLSYSRKDRERAQRIADVLREREFGVFKDTDDILPTEEWRDRLQQLIEEADTIVFLLSPHSASSEVCAWEVEHANSLNKRIAPIVIDEVDADNIPAALAKLNYIFCTERDRFEDAVDTLVAALHSDVGWIREHTRISGLARRWEVACRPNHLLLRGQDISDAEVWRDARPSEAPQVTGLQANFVSESRRAASRRQRVTMAGLFIGLICAGALAGIAYLQRGYALENEALARSERNSALIRESRFLADSSRRLTANGDMATAMYLTLQALPESSADPDEDMKNNRPYTPEAEGALYGALDANLEIRVRATSQKEINQIIINKRQGTIYLTSSYAKPHFWREGMADSQLFPSIKLPSGELIANCIYFNPSGENCLTRSNYDSSKKTYSTLQIEMASSEFNKLEIDEKYFVEFVSYNRSGDLVALYAKIPTGEAAKIYLFDGKSWKTKLTLNWAGGKITSMKFDDKSERLAVLDESNILTVWDTKKGTQLLRLDAIAKGAMESVVRARNGYGVTIGPLGFDAEARRLGFSADGKRLYVTQTHSLKIFDGKTGAIVGERAFGPTKDRFRGALINPDGETIVLHFRHKKPEVWDVQLTNRLFELEGHTHILSSLDFSHDGKRILTASYDGTARLWDGLDGTEMAVFGGHRDEVHLAVFSDEEKSVVTASKDGTIRYWRTEPDRMNSTMVLRGHAKSYLKAIFSPGGDRVATISADGITRLWSLDGTLQNILRGHSAFLYEVAFSPDGQFLATSSKDQTARLWRVRDGKTLFVFEHGEGPMVDVKFSPDGKHLATASADGTIHIHDIESGETLKTLISEKKDLSAIRYSADGKMLIADSRHLQIELFEIGTGNSIDKLRGEAFALSADGTKLAIVTRDDKVDSSITIWDLKTRTKLHALGHGRPVEHLSFSPDGTRLVSGAWDNTAIVWDAESGKPLARLIGHEHAVGQVRFSPNGTRIVTASFDGDLRLWTAESGQLMSQMKGHEEDEISSVQFNATGTKLVTGSKDGTARIWPVLPDASTLIRSARSAMPRCLTAAELKEAFLPPEPPDWCITGPETGTGAPPDKWRGLWPYSTKPWKDWLESKTAGRPIPMPTTP